MPLMWALPNNFHWVGPSLYILCNSSDINNSENKFVHSNEVYLWRLKYNSGIQLKNITLYKCGSMFENRITGCVSVLSRGVIWVLGGFINKPGADTSECQHSEEGMVSKYYIATNKWCDGENIPGDFSECIATVHGVRIYCFSKTYDRQGCIAYINSCDENDTWHCFQLSLFHPLNHYGSLIVLTHDQFILVSNEHFEKYKNYMFLEKKAHKTSFADSMNTMCYNGVYIDEEGEILNPNSLTCGKIGDPRIISLHNMASVKMVSPKCAYCKKVEDPVLSCVLCKRACCSSCIIDKKHIHPFYVIQKNSGKYMSNCIRVDSKYINYKFTSMASLICGGCNKLITGEKSYKCAVCSKIILCITCWINRDELRIECKPTEHVFYYLQNGCYEINDDSCADITLVVK
jgi:hypothetical protein